MPTPGQHERFQTEAQLESVKRREPPNKWGNFDWKTRIDPNKEYLYPLGGVVKGSSLLSPLFSGIQIGELADGLRLIRNLDGSLLFPPDEEFVPTPQAATILPTLDVQGAWEAEQRAKGVHPSQVGLAPQGWQPAAAATTTATAATTTPTAGVAATTPAATTAPVAGVAATEPTAGVAEGEAPTAEDIIRGEAGVTPAEPLSAAFGEDIPEADQAAIRDTVARLVRQFPAFLDGGAFSSGGKGYIYEGGDVNRIRTREGVAAEREEEMRLAKESAAADPTVRTERVLPPEEIEWNRQNP
jgi:hypothetical protein